MGRLGKRRADERRGKVAERNKKENGWDEGSLSKSFYLCLVFFFLFFFFNKSMTLTSSSTLKRNIDWDKEQFWWAEWTGTTGGEQCAVHFGCPLTEALIHLGCVLAQNLRSDKAQLCPCDPAHWVLSSYRCEEEKVGMQLGPVWDGWLTGPRVLNLLFSNSLMNPACQLPVSDPPRTHITNPLWDFFIFFYFPEWHGNICMQGYTSQMGFVVVVVVFKGRQPRVLSAPMLSLVSVPEPFRSLVKNVISFDSNFISWAHSCRCHAPAIKQKP